MDFIPYLRVVSIRWCECLTFINHKTGWWHHLNIFFFFYLNIHIYIYTAVSRCLNAKVTHFREKISFFSSFSLVIFFGKIWNSISWENREVKKKSNYAHTSFSFKFDALNFEPCTTAISAVSFEGQETEKKLGFLFLQQFYYYYYYYWSWVWGINLFYF